MVDPRRVTGTSPASGLLQADGDGRRRSLLAGEYAEDAGRSDAGYRALPIEQYEVLLQQRMIQGYPRVRACASVQLAFSLGIGFRAGRAYDALLQNLLMSVRFIGMPVQRWHRGGQSFGSVQARAKRPCQYAEPGVRPKTRPQASVTTTFRNATDPRTLPCRSAGRSWFR